MTPIFTPENPANKNVTWVSSDESVATVVDGLVTGISEGSAEITVTTEDGGFKATCDVTVLPYVKETIKYTINSLSTVSSSGTAPKDSTATYAQTHATQSQMTSGNSSTLTLIGYVGKYIDSITLSMKSNKSSGAGTLSVEAGTTTLASTEGAFNTEAWNNAWSNDYVDIEVRNLNSDYQIGNENITIVISATANSLYIESYTIQWGNAPVVPSITIDDIETTVLKGESTQLEATVKNANNPELIWESSNNSVATVDNLGNVSFLSVGPATITVKMTVDEVEYSSSIDFKVWPRTDAPISIADALAAADLTGNSNTANSYTAYGTVKSITTAYNVEKKNITIVLTDGINDITCYKLAGGEHLAVGDLISVSGKIIKYNNTTPEFIAASTYDVLSSVKIQGSVGLDANSKGAFRLLGVSGAADYDSYGVAYKNSTGTWHELTELDVYDSVYAYDGEDKVSYTAAELGGSVIFGVEVTGLPKGVYTVTIKSFVEIASVKYYSAERTFTITVNDSGVNIVEA